jgi:hypothetical protein
MNIIRIITAGLFFPLILSFTSDQDTPEGFVSLFDGKSFDGWVIPDQAVPHWKVVDGVMINDGIGREAGELIWTEREDYKDFIFKVEWRLSGKPQEYMHPLYDYYGDRLVDEFGNPVRKKGLFAGDSGVFFRGIRFDKNAPESSRNRFTDAQFNIWSNPMGSGQIHGYMVNQNMPPEVRRGAIPLKNADKPLGEWNSFVFTLKNDHVTVVLNGETIIQVYLPELPEAGAIGLQQHVPGRDAERPYPIEFRNIFVKEL